MAGGSGTRFWPRSRKRNPKQLLPLINNKTLLESTIDRIKPLCEGSNINIVTGILIKDSVSETISSYKNVKVIIEPKPRNTAPCVGYMASRIAHFANKDDVMVVLPSDHLIENTKRFLQIIDAGVDAANKYNTIITLGIKPTSPHTGYGYIQKGKEIKKLDKKTKLYTVTSFKEKPTLPVAKKFVNSGDYLWNSGMFIVKAGVMLDAIKKYMPELYKGLVDISKQFGTNREEDTFNKKFPELPAESIDYGVIEKLKGVITIPSDFDWNDLGSWKSLESVEKKRSFGVSNTDEVLAIDSKGNIINSDNKNKLIALLNVNDLIVVETKDALLIANKKDDQKIKELVDKLKSKGMEEYL